MGVGRPRPVSQLLRGLKIPSCKRETVQEEESPWPTLACLWSRWVKKVGVFLAMLCDLPRRVLERGIGNRNGRTRKCPASREVGASALYSQEFPSRTLASARVLAPGHLLLTADGSSLTPLVLLSLEGERDLVWLE